MARRCLLTGALLALAGCGSSAGTGTDARADAAPGPAPDCDDPALWSEAADAHAQALREPCACGAACDHPLQRVHVSIDPDADLEGYSAFCWRVVEAQDGSGWDAGQALPSNRDHATLLLRGHERSVRVEARSRDAAGKLLVARSEPLEVQPPSRRVEEVADLVGLYGNRSRLSYATETEVVVAGRDAPVAARGTIIGFAWPFWLEDVDGSAVLRWLDDEGAPAELALGIAAGGARFPVGKGAIAAPVVLSGERALVVTTDAPARVEHTLELDEEPDQAVRDARRLLVRTGDRVRGWRLPSGEPLSGEISAVDELVPGVQAGPDAMARIGRELYDLWPDEELALADDARATLSEDQLDRLGPVLALRLAGVWGENGFAIPEQERGPGPRFASATELYGGAIREIGGMAYGGDVFAVDLGDGRSSIRSSFTVSPCE